MATRRTRIVCISDTHNQTPSLPAGDILIHAGDLTNQGSYAELQKTVQWIEAADYEIKIVVAGNHDISLDAGFYGQFGEYFHHGRLEDVKQCLALLQNSPSITYLDHASKVLHLNRPNEPPTSFTVFGSPLSPSRGMWAFGYAAEQAFDKWEHIPLDADIVVTHTPAKFHCDESFARGAAGCEALRQTLWRVRPRLAVCGHVHEARGVEAVLWDLDCPNVKYREQSVRRWEDTTADSKKQFRVDISSKSRHPLQNNGAKGNWNVMCPDNWGRGTEISDQLDGMPGFGNEGRLYEDLLAPTLPPLPPFPDHSLSQRPISSNRTEIRNVTAATRGQGGPQNSFRIDRPALLGREGRKETCFVNAAFAASNWPHKGGKKFRKPIVIDIDLPVKDDALFDDT